MSQIRRKFVALCALGSAAAVAIAAVVTGGYYYVEPLLPQASELRNIEMQVPLSVYSRDGRLIAQFGEQKRTPVPFSEFPPILVKAVLAAEDDRFFNHPGIDFPAIARAAFSFIVTGGDRVPGGSTITQQVARQNFLTRDFSLVRKFREWILAVRIEQEFTKEEILELYLNTTFLGQRSYGVVAAARTYFDKDLDELTLSDAAIIAGIPRGPSILNPVSDPAAARDRRAYVLRRMRELGMITQAQHDEAAAVPVYPTLYGPRIELTAPYVAEMARVEMLRRFGPEAQTAGLKVTTTIDSRLQRAGNAAIRDALLAYDERHGYRGPLANNGWSDPEDGSQAPPSPEELEAHLADYPSKAGFHTAVVTKVEDQSAELYVPDSGYVQMSFDGLAWARPYISDNQVGPAPTVVNDVLKPGDVIRIRYTEEGAARLTQIPVVQGALVSLDPVDGAVVALNGGFDFSLNNFNRATQSRRQPGSAFKPFTFSAALENGFTVARIVNDAPIPPVRTEQEVEWRPRNSNGRFNGPVSLREILERSINVAAVRVVMEAGVSNVVEHVRKFGFDDAAVPRNLAVALGAGGVAPIDLARGYAAFANGGYRIDPYFIERVEGVDGTVLYEAAPQTACEECGTEDADADEPAGADAPGLVGSLAELYPESHRAPRIISPQNAYLITDMMRGVIRRGTGVRALALGRRDIAGKTGTTNEDRDTWFAGINADLVAVTWVGFNEDRPLGRGEEGARTALPMWISFMRQALDGVPERTLPTPPGIVEVRINPDNGLVASDNNLSAVFEKFRIDHVPPKEPDTYSSGELASDPNTSTTTRPKGPRIF